MTLKKRLQLATAGLALTLSLGSASIGTTAAASTPAALDAGDAQHYAAAFEACNRGDFIDARMQTAAIKDKSLLGYVSFSELTHSSPTFEDLAGWLRRFRDLPQASRVFSLAAKSRPGETASLPAPAVGGLDSYGTAAGGRTGAVNERGRRAREAYYAGNVRRALVLAPEAGERWIAGLSAYRLRAYDQAHGFFAELARDESEDAWIRSAAAFWSARAASALGDGGAATTELKLAAQHAETFYGMIARRELSQRQADLVGDPIGAQLIQASYTPVSADLTAFVSEDARAHRAAALAQLGRLDLAGDEVRAGMILARSPYEKARWSSLAQSLGASLVGGGSVDDFPAPLLAPSSGFTIDKALVYAIVRQESRFNPGVVSPVGAVGLMQLMPGTAALATGDDKFKVDSSVLFDPATNLRVGQDYLAWLMQRGVGFDLLRVVAAYNGGPGMVLKTAEILGEDADPLMLIESLPAQETRNYVERVMAAYWTYKKMFGEEAKTLDAIAGGARMIDARLDLSQPLGAPTQLSGQPLGAALR